MLASPWVVLTAAVAFIGATLGAYSFGRSDGRAIEQASQKRVEDIAAETRQAALEGAAQAIAGIEIKHVTVRQPLETRINEVPVYRDRNCQHDPDVLRLLNQALQGYPDEPPGGGQLPREILSPP